MDFKQEDYVLGVWFAEKKNGDNWLMTIKQKQGTTDCWEGEYRFRYKKDDKIFNSEDEKNVYSLGIDGESEDQIVEKLNGLFEVIKTEYTAHSEYVEIKGGMEKFMFRLAQCPWSNIKRFSGKEDYEAYVKENKDENICDTAPYPECNGANGCDTCEHKPED